MQSSSLTDDQAHIENVLAHHLPQAEHDPTRLYEAMRYSVLGQGKRLRPLLVYSVGRSLGVPQAVLEPAAVAVELIHAYSLIHDDLPAMDDDDLRRGKPTCHKVFGEAIAILAGDTLQSLAFQVLSDRQDSSLSAETHIHMLLCLTQACGVQGMAWGQALDLWATARTIDATEIERIHRCKTGALIHACVRLGFLSAERSDPSLENSLDELGHTLGLAFQIQDDILDIESSTEVLGKPQGSDVENQKATYPSVLGIDRSKEILNRLYERLIKILDQLPIDATPLRELIVHIFARSH